jgi:hypothetical protein
MTYSSPHSSPAELKESCNLHELIWHNPSMCGRFRLSRRKQLVMERFDAISDEPEWEPRYNIAPTQPAAVIRQHPTEPFVYRIL